MTQNRNNRRAFLGAALGAAAFGASSLAFGGQPRSNLSQPVFRVAKARPVVANNLQQGHPLDKAIVAANDALAHLRSNIRDYRCTLVKQERINNTLGNIEYIGTKIRTRKLDANRRIQAPLSVYMFFHVPKKVKGQEVLFVEGQNNNKLYAHKGGAAAFLPSVWLRPNGPLAMQGNLYPITEIGIENMIVKLLEKAHRDRKHGECTVQFKNNVTVGSKKNPRRCTLIQVTHPVPRKHFDFHIAQIFIDNEHKVPIRYAAYTWPAAGKKTPPLLESYTYMDLEVNIGLTDADFNKNNPSYNFVRKTAKKGRSGGNRK